MPDQKPTLEYRKPAQPDGNRGFKGMVIGAVAGWLLGIVQASLAGMVMARIEVAPRTMDACLLLTIASIFVLAAAGGYIGRQFGSRS